MESRSHNLLSHNSKHSFVKRPKFKSLLNGTRHSSKKMTHDSQPAGTEVHQTTEVLWPTVTAFRHPTQKSKCSSIAYAINGSWSGLVSSNLCPSLKETHHHVTVTSPTSEEDPWNSKRKDPWLQSNKKSYKRIVHGRDRAHLRAAHWSQGSSNSESCTE